MSSTYRPLACDLHDYLEIACLYGYRLRIELDDGSWLSARALDTRTLPNKEEMLLVEAAGAQRQLRLDHLRAITALTPGARFGRVAFKS
ncbi:Rho-binding antiterminator [Pseudomonas oryzae]|uniref:Transcriptional antiterminator, Rof n=1 Tax=Pseudomonas oryzae TaxID=1392877 RepID=A0A1H1UXL7_9PSED|nr:Rho-binding antiterminator [Pseudomonas oryzae]SDS76589.1 transcriptional antiterminator, Rof [Pseudomonas oryzae]